MRSSKEIADDARKASCALPEFEGRDVFAALLWECADLIVELKSIITEDADD